MIFYYLHRIVVPFHHPLGCSSVVWSPSLPPPQLLLLPLPLLHSLHLLHYTNYISMNVDSSLDFVCTPNILPLYRYWHGPFYAFVNRIVRGIGADKFHKQKAFRPYELKKDDKSGKSYDFLCQCDSIHTQKRSNKINGNLLMWCRFKL